MSMPTGDRGYLGELHHQNSDLQRELGQLKRELELTNQKLGSSMHSIKTFWSPELKKERALRKEESAKYSLINDQLKLLNSENQVSFFFLLSIVFSFNFRFSIAVRFLLHFYTLEQIHSLSHTHFHLFKLKKQKRIRRRKNKEKSTNPML